MAIKNADLPAHPLVALDSKDNPVPIATYGLTKREMIAMHIASGFAADGQITTDNVVKWSVETADALLAELDRTSK